MRNTFFSLRNIALLLPVSFLFTALTCCKNGGDDPQPIDNPPVTVYPDSLAGELKVQFIHTVDGQPLEFETKQYVSPANDSFKVVDLQYYISNLKLRNTTTGKTFALPNSYYLLQPKENKNTLSLKGIQTRDFNQLEFSIGVDQAANASTAHTGDLDPSNDMAWDWNTGYKFFVCTGNRISRIPAKNNTGLVYHIGENKNYKTLTFPLAQILSFQKNKPYTMQVGVNLNELFRNPNLIDFDVTNNVMGGPNAEKLANNYTSGMFTIQNITQ